MPQTSDLTNREENSYREGITLDEFFQRFPDNETAEQWLEKTRWERK